MFARSWYICWYQERAKHCICIWDWLANVEQISNSWWFYSRFRETLQILL